jgi:hypothetical protein
LVVVTVRPGSTPATHCLQPAPEVDGISCPSDAPAFKAEATPGHVIKLEWQRMPKADYIRIYVWIEHFGQWEIVEGSPKVVGEHGQWYDNFKVSGRRHLLDQARDGDLR